MIWPYTYIVTKHSDLNEYVLDFFRKIKYDKAGFRDELFDPNFLLLVNRHPRILKQRFKIIYSHLSQLPTVEREAFCEEIELANQIEKICRGDHVPKSFDRKVKGIHKIIKSLFLSLYNQVLDGKAFREIYNRTLRDHFNQLSDTNKSITLCPFCGISEIKKSADLTRDQYDHYLPKSLYPFSSINFSNLVPICKECNSFDVKGEKDSLAMSKGKIFFPYDSNHRGISLTVNVVNDNSDSEKIDLEFIFSTDDSNISEIESWKNIYLIEPRYIGYIKARIQQWSSALFELLSNSQFANTSVDEICKIYLMYLEAEHKQKLDYLKLPVVKSLLDGSSFLQARLEITKN